ncbi:HEAT repeat domain-containing protein [uncultured Maribacter sp.]|uniref:HEAT repeat domain-containing protein n=1 Tax=uncultured Maribacter sp. TaxID=431308 RepID=UPI00261651A1|nr:HEAT repeat domain-containing protein [uncultured Maribacter sp.]
MLSINTHNPRALITAPKIHTDLLWDLSLLFVGLALLYFLFIFYFRNKLSAKTKKVAQKKKDLSPIISEFLFFEEESSKDEKTNYIQLKIEIRQFLKDVFNRRILSEVLLDLSIDVSGSTQKSLFKLYKELDLHKDAYAKLESWRWEIVSKGILELTQMQVSESYGFIIKRINDKRGTIRKQAEIATVTLKHEGISYFLDTTRYKISEWQQLKILEVLRNKKDFNPPKFKQWLTSNNKYVVLFSLRLIKHYNQNDAELSIIELVKHKNTQIKQEAILCIKEFGFMSATDTLKLIFWNSSTDIKITILSALSEIGTEDDLPFLHQIENKERNFYVKSKALSTINSIAPETIMPTKEIEKNIVHNTPKDIVIPEEEKLIIVEKPEENTIENTEDSQESIEKVEDLKINDSIHELRQEELAIAINATDKEFLETDISDSLGFLPIVTSKEKENTITKDSKPEIKPEDIIVNFQKVVPTNSANIQVEYTIVELNNKNEILALNLDFLPIVTTNVIPEKPEEINPLDLQVIGEEISVEKKETLNIDFLPVIYDIINATEEPESTVDVPNSKIENITTIFEEISVNNEAITEEENTILNIDKLLSNENETTTNINVEEEFYIPKAVFCDKRELEMLSLLEDLNELGDVREIPLLEEYLLKEKDGIIKDRIIELLEKFYKELPTTKKEINMDDVTTETSILEELFTNADTESKLILLNEIVAVSDKKELKLLMNLVEDEDERVREKAKKCLEQLKAQIESKNTKPDDSFEPIPLEYAFLEDYKAELQKNNINPSKINNLDIEEVSTINKEPSFLEQFYSFSSKLFDKF